MSTLLSNKTAVVTGGASGIGRSIAITFAKEGCDMVVADVQENPREGGIPTHKVIREETNSASTFVSCDVSHIDDLIQSVDAASEFGGIDVMVNNAGILRDKSFLEVTEDEYDQLMNVNVKGTFFGSQAAARKMIKNGGGSIINMSSVSGLRGASGLVSYCTSKGAIRLMTYALADELGPKGIRVNAIHPGTIETMQSSKDAGTGFDEDSELLDKIPSGRFGRPNDVANAALYLASDLAEYVNGSSLTVDGGKYNTA